MKGTFPLALVLAVAGCAGGSAAAPRADVHSAGALCGESAPGVTWVDAAAGHLRVSLGQRPSGGYALELAPEPLRETDDGLLIRVREIEPAAGAMVTQMLTRPCLELRVTSPGYDRFVVATEAGEILGVVGR